MLQIVVLQNVLDGMRKYYPATDPTHAFDQLELGCTSLKLGCTFLTRSLSIWQQAIQCTLALIQQQSAVCAG